MGTPLSDQGLLAVALHHGLDRRRPFEPGEIGFQHPSVIPEFAGFTAASRVNGWPPAADEAEHRRLIFELLQPGFDGRKPL